MSAMVRFFKQAVQMGAKSEELGRPYFEDVDFIEILIAGDNFNQVVTKATEVHKEKYAGTFKKYLAGLEQKPDGYPVSEWSRLSKSQAENYKAMNFYTVEQIAEMTDSALQQVGMSGAGDRVAAKAFLAQVKDAGLAEKQAIQIETMAAEIKRQSEQIRELGALAEKKDSTLHVKKG